MPDFSINTGGRDLLDAIYIARDVIGIMCIDMEDCNEAFPEPSDMKFIFCEPEELFTLVDGDFIVYRRKYDNRTARIVNFHAGLAKMQWKKD